MISVTSTTNAPGTNIQVHSIKIEFLLSGTFANLNVTLYDGYSNFIRLPQQVRPITPSELSTFLATPATVGETMSQLVVRAAAPYILSAYGITYATS